MVVRNQREEQNNCDISFEMVLREQGGRTRDLICNCQYNKRQWNLISFKGRHLESNFVLFPLA